jgi:hypothetical protein
MMALQGHLSDFAVFGDDYDTPDGTAIRDYVHVTDLAAAHVQALQLLMQGHSGGIFNLGTGTGFSVRQILAAIAAETGREVPHVVKPRRAGDPTYLVADPSAARETLKFKPAHSDLATIIRTAWAWHQKAHQSKAGEPVAGNSTLPRHGRRRWALRVRRGAMMLVPTARSNRQSHDRLRSSTTPRSARVPIRRLLRRPGAAWAFVRSPRGAQKA